MRAVVDTNILIRALIKPAGTVGPVIRRLVAGDYTIIYFRQLVTELLEKLSLPRLKDKYGLSWQIVPAVVMQMITDPDSSKSQRVMQALLKMKKLDMETLKKAYEGTSAAA